jgi:hypothetical protein
MHAFVLRIPEQCEVDAGKIKCVPMLDLGVDIIFSIPWKAAMNSPVRHTVLTIGNLEPSQKM